MKVYGAQIMNFAAITSVKTASMGIPWRRNLLCLLWVAGFLIYSTGGIA